MILITVKVKDFDAFRDHVFGADDFLIHFPQICGEGIEVFEHRNGNFYVVKNGRPADRVYRFENSTCFFSPAEMKYLAIVEVR